MTAPTATKSIAQTNLACHRPLSVFLLGLPDIATQNGSYKPTDCLPANPAVPSLRQEVLAAKVAAIQSARQATPSTTRSQSPVVAAATDSPRPGIAQLLGAVAAGIAGAIGLVLVGLSIWDRHGASQRITDAARTALRARLLEQAARIDQTPKPG